MSAKKTVDRKRGAAEEAEWEPKFHIDLDLGEATGRSPAFLTASRKCYQDRQKDTPESIAKSNPKTHIRRISQHCVKTDDYLLPDTPLKEAIFRILLSEGNREMTAREVSEALTAKWALSTNRRDVSVGVVQQLLENGASYSIVGEPEPEPEPEVTELPAAKSETPPECDDAGEDSDGEGG